MRQTLFDLRLTRKAHTHSLRQLRLSVATKRKQPTPRHPTTAEAVRLNVTTEQDAVDIIELGQVPEGLDKWCRVEQARFFQKR